MKSQRSFSLEFKRQVVQELLSGESSPAQLYRRHNIVEACLTTGRGNTAGANSIMNFPTSVP